MSFIGKLHEISLYGLIVTIAGLVTERISLQNLWEAAFCVINFRTFFCAYLFWASSLFIPIAIIGAFSTKYSDDGQGLTFGSDNIVVIIFAHIAEELLGLISTPFWFLKDLFTHDWDNGWKAFDYFTYFVELILIAIGILLVFI